MIKTTSTILVAALTIFTAIAVAINVDQLRPCPTEDSVNCTWYGPLQGNGDGKVMINW